MKKLRANKTFPNQFSIKYVKSMFFLIWKCARNETSAVQQLKVAFVWTQFLEDVFWASFHMKAAPNSPFSDKLSLLSRLITS